MKVIPASETGIQAAIEVLHRGGVVAHATETCYGLACDLKNPEAVQRLFAIKKRPEGVPVSALFSSIDEAQIYLEWNEEAMQLASKHLPGPLTIILRQNPQAPHYLFPCPSPNPNPNPTIGLRISPHPTAKKLVEQFGSPLSTTSANIHGKPNPYSVEDIKSQYEVAEDAPDLVLDDGTLPSQEASTVIDVSDGNLHILRNGNISL